MSTIVEQTLNTLYSIRVDGVRTHAKFPPYTFSTASYPLLFIRNIGFQMKFRQTLSGMVELSSANQVSTGTCEVVIVVESFKQGTAAQNYEKSRELMNSLVTAFLESDLLLSDDGIDVKEDFELTGDTALFVVIANVSFLLEV